MLRMPRVAIIADMARLLVRYEEAEFPMMVKEQEERRRQVGPSKPGTYTPPPRMPRFRLNQLAAANKERATEREDCCGSVQSSAFQSVGDTLSARVVGRQQRSW